MSDIKELRKNIDLIDEELINLFIKRMETVEEIGEYKKQNDIKTFDKNRENEILSKLNEKYKDNKFYEYIKEFELNNIKLSREYQNKK